RPQPCPVANAGHPNHGDRTVRFPVVMAGSRVSLVSLAGTYSTALFAMMSTPQWRTDCDQGLLVCVQVQAPDRPTLSSSLATRRVFLRCGGRPLPRHCARQPTRDAVLPQTVR